MAVLPDGNDPWNHLPATNGDVFTGPVQPSYYDQSVNTVPNTSSIVRTANTVSLRPQRLQHPSPIRATAAAAAAAAEPTWNQIPTSDPIKVDSCFDTTTHIIDYDTTTFFDNQFNSDYLFIPSTSISNQDLPNGLPLMADIWSYHGSLGDQSECGQSFSSTGSIDQLSPSNTYYTDNTSRYTETRQCPKTDTEYGFDIPQSPHLQLSVPFDPRNIEQHHRLSIPLIQPSYEAEAPYYPVLASSEHWQAELDEHHTSELGIKSSWLPVDWDMKPRRDWDCQQSPTRQALWSGGPTPSTVRTSHGNEVLARLPSKHVPDHSPYPDSPAVDLENISTYSNSRRKKEDYFLVRSKQMGMTYKQIREEGGLQQAESTLRGRYRSLTKQRKDRVRKPVWTDNDLRLLQLAVQVEINGLQAAGVIRSTNIHVVGSKVSWKKVSDCIMQHGGSYRFGNATCKKKWKEIQH